MRGETVSPSFSRSSSAIRSSPQVGFARAMATISRCRSAGIGGRPGRDFHRQKSRQPSAVPADERVRLHHGQQRTPVQPSRQQDERDARRRVGPPRLGPSLLIERQLFSQEQVLRRQVRPGRQPQANQGEKSSSKRQTVRSKKGRRFDMAPYRNRPGSGLAPPRAIERLAGSIQLADAIFADHASSRRAVRRSWPPSAPPPRA